MELYWWKVSLDVSSWSQVFLGISGACPAEMGQKKDANEWKKGRKRNKEREI